MKKRLLSAVIVLLGIVFLWDFIPNLYGNKWDEPMLWLYTIWVLGTTAIVVVVAFRNAFRGIRFED